MVDGYERLVPPDGLRKTGRPHWLLHSDQTQTRGIPVPVAGLSTLLVWLCQVAMVISMEIGNWEKMWMWLRISHSCWGVYTSNVSRSQGH